MPEVDELAALQLVSEYEDGREGLHQRFSNLIQAAWLACSWQSKGASCTKWLISLLLLSLLIGAILLQQQFRVPSFIPGAITTVQWANCSTASPNLVCWHGPPMSDGGTVIGAAHVHQVLSVNSSRANNIKITGHGCHTCYVGHLCTFVLYFASTNLFMMEDHDLPEVMVTLEGPSKLNARVSIMSDRMKANAAVTLHVTYQAWDAGVYYARINSDCSRPTVVQELAYLNIEIKNGSKDANGHKFEPPPTPCELGIYARWVLADDSATHSPNSTASRVAPAPSSKYVFEAYPCIGKLEPIREFAPTMLRKGIREITFLGDSHMRNLAMSLEYFAMGGADTGYKVKYSFGRRDHIWTFVDEKTRDTLTINLLFAGGLYVEGQDGCGGSDPGIGLARARYPPTSDVVILDAATWELSFCPHPLQEYPRLLQPYLDKLLSLPHKPGTQFWWRSAPPFPIHAMNCAFRGNSNQRNSHRAWANELTKSIVEGNDVKYLDLWPVESPQYREPCKMNGHTDHHYICEDKVNGVLYGIVGEAVVQYVAHLLMAM